MFLLSTLQENKPTNKSKNDRNVPIIPAKFVLKQVENNRTVKQQYMQKFFQQTTSTNLITTNTTKQQKQEITSRKITRVKKTTN